MTRWARRDAARIKAQDSMRAAASHAKDKHYGLAANALRCAARWYERAHDEQRGLTDLLAAIASDEEAGRG